MGCRLSLRIITKKDEISLFFGKEMVYNTLSFPNEEVRYGFLESLMPSYVPKAMAGNGLEDFDKFQVKKVRIAAKISAN